MNPILVITHAAFDEQRRQSLHRLTARLRTEAPKIPFRIISDDDRMGSLWCWKKAMDTGLAEEASHIVWLPDDALICDDFGDLLMACIEARPGDVFQCYVNDSRDLGQALWFSSYDGYCGMGGVMPRALLVDHLKWRKKNLPADSLFPNDAGVCLWAMDTGRLLYCTAYSLVQHDESLGSLDGHDGQRVERTGLRPVGDLRHAIMADIKNLLGRTWGAPEAHNPGYRTSTVGLGRVYTRNHLALLTELTPPRVERYWDVERLSGIPEGQKKVFFALPGHGRGVDQGVVSSVMRETRHLVDNGWNVQIDMECRDSHVNRVRNRLVSRFLVTDCSHLLFWDRDNFPLGTGAVLKLLETGHDVVGGAVPLKDGSGTMFAMQLGKNPGDYAVELEGHCLPAAHVGTGFLLISRKAIVKMATELHKETFYLSGMDDSLNRAEWFLFADAVRNQKHLSEDWEFCRKWQDLGGKVYVRPDIDFVHIGEHPYLGSFDKTFGKGPS